MIAWSYSVISSFKKCPAQYKAVRVDKLYPYVQGPEAAEGERQHLAFENYVKKSEPLPDNMAHHKPMMDSLIAIPGSKHAEFEIVLDQHGAWTGWRSQTAWLRAKLDLLIKVSPEEAIVVDFKTGKSRYADTSQLKLGAAMLFKTHPSLQRVKAALLFTKENKPVTAEYTRDKESEYWQEFMTEYAILVRAHEQNAFYPKPSGLCKSCPHVVCPNHRG